MGKRKMIFVIGMSMLLLFSSFLFGEGQAEEAADGEWKPERPVQVICWSGAGGGTDLQSRAMAEGLKQFFEVPFNVTNMTGGAGAVAANYVLDQPRNGYTIMGISEGIHGIPVIGGTDATSEDFEMIMVLSTPGVISVPKKSDIQDLDDLIKAAKNKTLKAASSQAGSIWTMKLLQFEEATGVDLDQIPYEGSHPSQVAALQGEVDVVLTGLAEQKEYILAEEFRPIVVVESESSTLEGYGEIKAVAEDYPKYKELPRVIQWVGMGIPSDSPQHIIDAYKEAWAYAIETKEVQNLAKTAGFDVLGYMGDDMRELAAELDSVFAWTLWDAGLAQINPEELGIPRP